MLMLNLALMCVCVCSVAARPQFEPSGYWMSDPDDSRVEPDFGESRCPMTCVFRSLKCVQCYKRVLCLPRHEEGIMCPWSNLD